MNIVLDDTEMLKAIQIYLALRGYGMNGKYEFIVANKAIEFKASVERAEYNIDRVVKYAQEESQPETTKVEYK